jgi:ribosome-binding factor A
MIPRRHERLQDELRRAVGQILTVDSQDPRLSLVSVTRVRLSRDLSLAKVYVSHLGNEQSHQEMLAALQGARGFVRSVLAGRVRMKRVPELVFRHDSSLSDAARIHELLDGSECPADS